MWEIPVPKKLVPSYCELVSANPKSRPNPGAFLQECRKKGGFLNNSFVESMLFLEEIQIKDQAEKNKFFASLTPSLDSFPPQMCRNKILPQLLNAFEYGNAGSSILPPMFKIEFFVEHLSHSVVNDQIFPNISSGFMDTNPVVREATVKAMLHLAGKLNYKNLNEELMKHFARLQSKDDQAFKAIHGFLDKLEKLSENPDLQEEMEREVMTGGSATAMSPAGWAGWAVTGMSSLTSKFYSKGSRAKPTPPAGMGPQSTAPTPKPSSEEARPASFAKEPTRDLPSSRVEEEEEEDPEASGWDEEDWGDMDVSSASVQIKPSNSSEIHIESIDSFP
nr:hypothetical protein BaRGS_023846 [Batillaria attramentaria]